MIRLLRRHRTNGSQSGWIRVSLLVIGALLLLSLLLVSAGAVWLGSSSGLAFMLKQAGQMVADNGGHFRASGARGGLYRGVTFERLEWSDGKTAVNATKISARWSLRSILRREVVVPEVTIDAVEVQLPAADEPETQRAEAIAIPEKIGLPVSFELSRFRLNRLTVYPALVAPAKPAEPKTDKPAPFVASDIRFAFHYQDGAYSLSSLQTTLPWGQLTDTRLSLNDTSPHAVVLRSVFKGHIQTHPLAIKAAALGSLNGLNASVKGEFDQSPVSVDIRVRPLEPNPVVSVIGWIRKLNLERIAPQMPDTAIDLDFDLLNPRALPRVETVLHSDGTPVEKKETEQSAPPQGHAAWRGTLALSNANSGSYVKKQLPLRTLAASLQIDATADSQPSRLTLSALKLGMPGATQQATVTGAAEVMLRESVAVAGTRLPVIVAALQFRNIDLAQFVEGASPTAMNGSFDLTRNLFRLDLSQSQGPLPQAVSLPGGGRATIRTQGRISDNAVNLDSALIQLDSSRLTASGRATLKQPVDLAMAGSLENLDLSTWLPRQLSLEPRLRDGTINADWSVNGTVSPTLDARISLSLSGSSLMKAPLRGHASGQITTGPGYVPTQIKGADLQLRLGSNAISASGNLGDADDTLTLSGLVTTPAIIEPRLGGSMKFNGRLQGKFNSLQAQLELAAERLRWQADQQQPVAAEKVRLKADMPVVTGLTADTALSLALTVDSLSLPGRKLDSLSLDIDGIASRHNIKLQASAQGQQVSLAADGALDLNQSMVWRGRIAELRSRGPVTAGLNGAAKLAVGARQLQLSGLDLSVLSGRARINRLIVSPGSDADGAGASMDLRASVSKLPVAKLAAFGSKQEIPPQLQGLTVDGQIELRGASADDLTGAIKLALSETRRPAGNDKTPRFGLNGRNGADVRINNGNLSGSVYLNLPSLAFTREFTGSDWVIDGQAELQTRLAGSLRAPQWDARLSGSNLSLFQPALGWRFSGGELDARFADSRISIQTLRLNSGDGTLTLTGSARLLDGAAGGGGQGLPLDGRFTLTTDRTVVPLGPGQRLVLSGTSAISSARAGVNWTGKLQADEGLIEIAGSGASALPSDVTISDDKETVGADRSDKAKESGASPSPTVRADLAVDLGRQLRITGGGINALLTGKLRLHGDLPDEPKVSGEVNIEDGSYFAYSQELDIERGVVRFTGAPDNPLLDIVAVRPKLPVKVGVAIGGTALSPKAQLTSTPPLSDAETLSWLVLGTPLQNAGAGAQSLALKQAATAFLASDDGSLAGGGLSEKIGVDFGIGYASDTGQAQAVTDVGAPTGLPGSTASGSVQANDQVFTLGKKLSDRLSVSYEKGLEGVWNLLRIQYEISNRLSLRAQTGSESALDLIYFFSFD